MAGVSSRATTVPVQHGICVIKACYRFHLSPVPIAEKRLMDVKLGELGTWLGGRDFTPNGIISSLRRGEETCPD